MSDVKAAEDESIFLLHACAHNPTGVDPSQEQWKELSQLMKAKKHIAFFDCAYQVQYYKATVHHKCYILHSVSEVFVLSKFINT